LIAVKLKITEVQYYLTLFHSCKLCNKLRYERNRKFVFRGINDQYIEHVCVVFRAISFLLKKMVISLTKMHLLVQ